MGVHQGDSEESAAVGRSEDRLWQEHGVSMTTEQITENAKAILLLCGRFGAGDDTGDLAGGEYGAAAVHLVAVGRVPGG